MPTLFSTNNNLDLQSKKRTELNDISRPIHYLGSKLRILTFIEKIINDLDPTKGKVCDLFSGSGSVSYQLSKTRPVTAVDIQEYSSVICNSLLKSKEIDKEFLEKFIDNCKNSNHTRNLIWTIDPLVQYEASCMHEALENFKLENLCDILENGSIIGFEITKNTNAQKSLEQSIIETLSRLKEKKVYNKQSLAIRYFGGIYFSYLQAMQIDAVLEEIDNSPIEFRSKLLAAVLSSASECVNTVGKQFAQPLRPRKSNNDIKPSLGKIVYKDRSLNFLDIYVKWITKYNSIIQSPFSHQILKMDYIDALNSLGEDTTVIYADPPYTRDHYSRFYHVLETIALRDLPEISTMVLNGETILSRGLYRSERHQSPFCIRSQAPIAFESMFSKARSIDVKLVLSYSPYDELKGAHPRVVTMYQLQELAQKYFNHIDVVSPGDFIHSKLNNSIKHLEASTSAEVLIICT